MMRLLFLVLSLASFMATPRADAEAGDAPPIVGVTPLVEGVWLHRSSNEVRGFGLVEANGLLVADGDGLLMIDTPWTDRQTDALLRLAEEQLGRSVVRAVATHWHQDCAGGGSTLAERGIPLAGSALTQRLAAVDGREVTVTLPLDEPGDRAAFGPVEVMFPGPGHATDNVVVWVPAARLLFGGCAVRAEGAGGIGFAGDGDVDAWPATLGRVRAAYPDAEVVVPGHGEPGGPGLLDHTLDLLAAETPGAADGH